MTATKAAAARASGRGGGAAAEAAITVVEVATAKWLMRLVAACGGQGLVVRRPWQPRRGRGRVVGTKFASKAYEVMVEIIATAVLKRGKVLHTVAVAACAITVAARPE